MIKVLINGASGKMGRVTVESIAQEADLELVAQTGHTDDLATAIQSSQADVVVDFTVPDTIFEQTQIIIAHRARPVIGTSGLTYDQVQTLQAQCREQSVGGVIAPNFSLGAVLMMRYAKDAAKHFPDAEIIEMHHQQKVDAPSGTAAKTAQMMAEARSSLADSQPHPDRARGEHYQGVTIHSVRLPGLFAHQEVIFGGLGETLTIRHDGMDRKSMMPGVFLCCRKAMELDHLVYGLEEFL